MTTDTATLADFLLARIADDERVARTLHEWDHHGEGWVLTRALDEPQPDEIAFAERWSTARVLAECEAKRRIVGIWSLQMSEPYGDEPPAPIGGQGAEVYYETLQHLALPYVDHPDYREEWRA